MQFLATVKMGFKFLWKDPVTVTVMTLFPIVIILILGTALENVFTAEVNLEPTSIAVVAEPHGNLGTFMQNDEITRFFDVEFTDLERARELVADGTVIAAFVEQNFGEPIKAIMPASTSTMGRVALTFIDSYQQIGAAATIALMGGRDIYGIGMNLLAGDVQVTTQPLGTRIPSAMDFYAVTMLIMILMFAGLNGMELFHKGLFSETGTRVRLSPVTKPSLVGGLLTAATVTSFLQGMVVFVFTATVYGVYWGNRIPLVLLTLFGVLLLSQALCILLLTITGNKNAVIAISQVFIFIATFVSGGYMPVDFGGIFGRIFQFAPNALAHTVVFGAIYGGDERVMATSLVIIFSTGIVMMLLSFILGRRRLV